MTFIDHAQILIPATTGLSITLLDPSIPSSLHQFEKENCLSPELQPLYTASGLRQFIDKKDDRHIYDISDALDTRALLLKIQDQWIILGPYVISPWNETAAKLLLADAGAQDAMRLPYKAYRCRLPLVERKLAVHIAVLLVIHTVGNDPPYWIETIDMPIQVGQTGKPRISQSFEQTAVVNRRYEVESQFIETVAQGRATRSLELHREMQTLTPGLSFMSDDLKDQIAGAAIGRTLIRRAAIQGGLTPVMIDAISQEYAQQMHRAADTAVINDLMEHCIVAVCQAIYAAKKGNHSIYIKRAVEYIETHLSQPISVDALCRLSGVSRKHFVSLFSRETGKTVKQYIAQARCECAAELLENSQLPVHEISAYVGYEDNNYFTKIFKSVMGMSPQEYRKMKAFY